MTDPSVTARHRQTPADTGRHRQTPSVTRRFETRFQPRSSRRHACADRSPAHARTQFRTPSLYHSTGRSRHRARRGETVERMPDPRREQDAAGAVESKRTHRQWVGHGIRSVVGRTRDRQHCAGAVEWNAAFGHLNMTFQSAERHRLLVIAHDLDPGSRVGPIVEMPDIEQRTRIVGRLFARGDQLTVGRECPGGQPFNLDFDGRCHRYLASAPANRRE